VIRDISIAPIGVIHSCFSEKFGIPRQSGMVKSATAFLELLPPFNREEMVRGLHGFSHIWVHFLFHQALEEGWRPTVRPPWLGGKKRVGIFATRSPHRPNHIGMSAVKLIDIRREKKTFTIKVTGGDFLDQTPVLDIKPYVPYCDSVETATSGYTAYNRSDRLEVEVLFSKEASLFCAAYEQDTGREICLLIEEMIRQDPRPASQKGTKKQFGMLLWDVNIRWQVIDSQFQVLACRRVR
jgi:tRNA-Thr(GGU) m(6)t(6)A37 methyltransferase TsaA